MIHRKKNRPALQRRDILTVSLVSFFISFFYIFFIGNLPSSSSTQFLVVLFFLAFYTDPFTSKHFLLGLFGVLFLFLSHFSDCVDFTDRVILLIFLRDFSWVFYRAFLLSCSILSSRATLSSENACHQFLCRWHVTATLTGWFTHIGKQVVNRLKIPQGLSTLMFRRWSEVPSRGGVRGDSL